VRSEEEEEEEEGLFTARRRRRQRKKKAANAMREVDQGLCRKRDKAENACA